MWFCALLIVVSGSVINCSDSSTQNRSQSDDIINLTYWSSPNPQEYTLAQELVEQWNTENPRIQVKVQALPAGQSSEEVLLSAMVAGTTPDVCSNIWPGITNDFIRADGLVALDTFPDYNLVMGSRVPQDILESVKSADGHTYQVPWKTNPIMVQYNVDLFEEAGITTFPKTYSTFLEAAAKITKDTNGDGLLDRWMGYRDIRPIWWQRYYDFYTSYIAASAGQTLFDQGELAIDEKAATQVFEFYQELYANSYFPKTTFQGNAFLFGQIATEFTGPWNITFLKNNAPDSLKYDYAPIPVPDDYEGEIYTYGDHKNIAIFSTTEHPKESWEFVKFLISKEADYKLLSEASQIPIRKQLLEQPPFSNYLATQPKLARFAEQASYTRGVDAVRDFKEILDVVSRYYERTAVYGKQNATEGTHDMIEAIKVLREWNR
jgi:multiple sugar transport system substrate-binding protein